MINSFVRGNKLNSTDFLNYVQDYVDCWYFDTNISEQGEELYIYMNARGEQIQNNENIKADLLGSLKETDIDLVSIREDFDQTHDINGLKKYWGKKWEDWQDYFWAHRGKNENADNGFNEFLRWVQIISMTKNAIIDINNENENSPDKKEIIEVIKWEKEAIKLNVKYLQFAEIEKYLESLSFVFEPNSFKTSENLYENYELNVPALFEQNWLESFSKTANKENHLSQIDCFRLLPLLEFARQQKEIGHFNDVEIYRFARYLYNLSRVSNISKAANVNCINAIKLANALNFSVSEILNIESVSKTLLSQEEKLKFELYSNPPSGLKRESLEEKIWSTEDIPVLKGEIAIIFDLIEFQNVNIPNFKIDEFVKVSDIFKLVFKNHVSDLFRKALLSIKDYKIQESYTYSLEMFRYHLCDTIDEWNELINKSDAFKSLILRLETSVQIVEDLQIIIDENMPFISDWRLKYLKAEISILKFSEEKRVCIKGEKVFLMKRKIAHNENYYRLLE